MKITGPALYAYKRKRESIIQAQLRYMRVHLLTFSLYCIVSHFMHIIIIVYDWWVREKRLYLVEFFYYTLISTQIRTNNNTNKKTKDDSIFFFFLTNRRQTNISSKIVLCLWLNDVQFRWRIFSLFFFHYTSVYMNKSR